MSENSSSSSSGGSNSSCGSSSDKSTLRLCQRIQRRLSCPLKRSMAVSDHKIATETMAVLKLQLLESQKLCNAGKMCLTCAGIAISRRLYTEIEMPDTNKQLKTTLALLFVLVVLSNGDVPLPSGGQSLDEMSSEEEDAGETEDMCLDAVPSLLETWNVTPLANLMEDVLRDSESESWTDALCDPGALCKSALKVAMDNGTSMPLDSIVSLALCFFRSSAMAMVTALFNSCSPPGDDFLTLGTASLLAAANENRCEKLKSIADVAESEAGQSVFRDIVLSFTLPRDVVGVRRTCLLGREANAKATELHSVILNSAHEAAMRGAEYTWDKDENMVYKTGALLAGVAILVASGAQAIRKADAFSGRVDLPFLETQPPEPGVARLALLESSAEWLVFSVSPKTGKPVVQLRASGFEGLCQAVLCFVGHLKL